jgi:hypothetical protein
MLAVAIPIIVFVLCLGAGVFAASRWLPDLAPGPVGGVSFFVVCGLAGAALGVFGLNIYEIVENLNDSIRVLRHLAVADGLETILWQCGLLIGLAAAVYLLAPAGSDGDPAGEP